VSIMSNQSEIEMAQKIILKVYYKLGLDKILNEKPEKVVIDTRSESELIDIIYGIEKNTDNLIVTMWDSDILNTTKYVAFNLAHDKMDFLKKNINRKKKILFPLILSIFSIGFSFLEYEFWQMPIFIKILINAIISAGLLYYIIFIYTKWKKKILAQFKEILKSIKSDVNFSDEEIEEYLRLYDWKEYIIFPVFFIIFLISLIGWILNFIPMH